MPVEVPNPIRFEDDVVHRSYDRAPVEAFHQALVAMTPVFQGSARASSASRARCISSGAASTSRPRASRADARPSGPAPIRSRARRTRTKSSATASGRAAAPSRSRRSTRTRRPSRRDFVTPRRVRRRRRIYVALSEFILPYEAVRTSRTAGRRTDGVSREHVRRGGRPGRVEPRRNWSEGDPWRTEPARTSTR